MAATRNETTAQWCVDDYSTMFLTKHMSNTVNDNKKIDQWDSITQINLSAVLDFTYFSDIGELITCQIVYNLTFNNLT